VLVCRHTEFVLCHQQKQQQRSCPKRVWAALKLAVTHYALFGWTGQQPAPPPTNLYIHSPAAYIIYNLWDADHEKSKINYIHLRVLMRSFHYYYIFIYHCVEWVAVNGMGICFPLAFIYTILFVGFGAYYLLHCFRNRKSTTALLTRLN